MSDDRKALMVKLGRARKAIEPLEKSGDNKDEGFKFVKAVSVVEEANRVLAGRGILILPSVEDSSTGPLQSGGVLTKVRISFEVVDTDTGFSFEKKGIGSGFDRQGDRAIYKAITGATKYFLIGLLSIPVVGGDPEDDGTAPAATTEPEPGKSPEAQKAAAEQDRLAEEPDLPPRVAPRHKPLPKSDLPGDWTGLKRAADPEGEPVHA